MINGEKDISMHNELRVAPAPGSIPINPKTVAVGVVIAAALLWIALANLFQPPKPVVVTATPTATPAPQPQPQPPPSTSMLMMCQGEAYKTRSGLIVCGVTMVDQQYVWLQQGWIAPAGNMSASFSIIGDTSSCQFQLSVNRLVVNCKSPIAVSK